MSIHGNHPVAAGGEVLHPNITWVDGRARRAGPLDDAALSAEESSSNELSASNSPARMCLPKLVWLRQERPDIYRRTHKILDVGGYLRYRATGRMDDRMVRSVLLFVQSQEEGLESSCTLR